MVRDTRRLRGTQRGDGPQVRWHKVQDILRQYGLPEEDHCASRWKEGSHLVRLHVVGFERTRRQQQEEALQLVVRGVWRQIRMESTQ